MFRDWLYSVLSQDIGIDLGTATTLVYVRGEGIVLCEPSVVAVRKGDNRVLMNGQAVGSVAKQMVGKAPASIVVIRPLKNGVIADFAVPEAMLSYFIRKVHDNRTWGVRPRVIIAVPSGITAVEMRAVIDSAERSGARKVYVIEEPKAASIGIGLPITEPTGSMIVDIGGGTTEVAVLSLGGIVSSQSLRIAGDEMDAAIINHMKRTYNLLIGESTAERIKIEIGSAAALPEEMVMEVKGRDLIAGLPRMALVRSEEIREALKEPVDAVINAVKITLERTPPEIAADLLDRGIAMVGGGSLLRGLDQVVAKDTGLPVKVADDPKTAVVRGTGEVLERWDEIIPVLEGAKGDSY